LDGVVKNIKEKILTAESIFLDKKGFKREKY